MSKLLQALGQSDAMSAADAWKIYQRLLEKDSDKPEDQGKMREAMETLGKSLTDARADLQILQAVRRWQDLYGRCSTEEEREKAAKAIVDSMAEREAWLKDWADRHVRLNLQQTELHHRREEAINAARKVRELKRTHAGLLSHVAELSDNI